MARPARSRYDVVVVGAGAFGLASAYHLARAEPRLSILVVEARAGPGEGSMGASNAMVRDVFSAGDNRLLARSSIRFYRSLMDTREDLRSAPPLLDLYGYLWLLPERLATLYSRAVAESRGLIEAETVDLETVRSCPGLAPAPSRWYEGDAADPPEEIVQGLFARNCGALAPERLASFYFEEACASGVEFAFDRVVQRLTFEGREEILLHEDTQRPFSFQEQMRGRLKIGRVVFGDGSSVQADRVIVAGGAWSEKILHPLGVATGCSPRPQSLFSISGPAVDRLLDWRPAVPAVDLVDGRPRLPFVILPTGATLKPIFRQRHIWLEAVDRIAHPIGAREDPGATGTLDYDMARMGSREGFATDMLPAVSPYFPDFEGAGARLERTWGGYYNFSPDGRPVLVDEPFGVMFVGGDSGSGVMKADALGRLVAAKFAGKSEAQLYTGESIRLDRLSLERRATEEERFIL